MFRDFFQDTDDYLTFHMKEKLKKGLHFTPSEVIHYHDIIDSQICMLRQKYDN